MFKYVIHISGQKLINSCKESHNKVVWKWQIKQQLLENISYLDYQYLDIN